VLPGIPIVFDGAIVFDQSSLGVALGKFFVRLGDVFRISSSSVNDGNQS
jgi:hypothetical protein